MCRVILVLLAGFSTCVSAVEPDADKVALPDLAIVMQVAEGFSPQAVAEMQVEAGRIIGRAGRNVAFIQRDQAAANTYNDLVMFKLTGRCEMDNFPPLLDERGPLAWTFTEQGRVLPFGEVKCDRLRESIKTVMGAREYAKANSLLGRAMGACSPTRFTTC